MTSQPGKIQLGAVQAGNIATGTTAPALTGATGSVTPSELPGVTGPKPTGSPI